MKNCKHHTSVSRKQKIPQQSNVTEIESLLTSIFNYLLCDLKLEGESWCKTGSGSKYFIKMRFRKLYL